MPGFGLSLVAIQPFKAICSWYPCPQKLLSQGGQGRTLRVLVTLTVSVSTQEGYGVALRKVWQMCLTRDHFPKNSRLK